MTLPFIYVTSNNWNATFTAIEAGLSFIGVVKKHK